jgi:hypothetical protein
MPLGLPSYPSLVLNGSALHPPVLRQSSFVSSLLFARDSNLVLALDTCSDVSIGRIEFLKDVRLVKKTILVEGCGGRLLFEMEGELSLVGNLEITVFAVEKGDLPPNSHALMGNPHLRQLRVSSDFAQNHPHCRLEDAIDYGRSLVFPRTFLLPASPTLAGTAEPRDKFKVSLWLLGFDAFVLVGLALALSPQAHLGLLSLACMIEPRALVFALIALFLSRLVFGPESFPTVLESLVRPQVGIRTVLPVSYLPQNRPRISPSLSPEERARFDATGNDFAQLFVPSTASWHGLGGKFPHELDSGRVRPMHVYEDRSYPVRVQFSSTHMRPSGSLLPPTLAPTARNHARPSCSA